MTARQYFELDFVFILLVAAILGMTFALSTHRPNNHVAFSVPDLQNKQAPSDTIAPIQDSSFSQISPDGTQKVTILVHAGENNTKTYTIITSQENGSDTHTLFTIALPDSESITIPFNTWSPDNHYVFIEHNTPNNTQAWIFQANGQPLSQETSYLNANALFDGRNTGDTYQEATGWSSETLLIINTTTLDGKKGPSYWFDVPSKSIIPLSTEF